MWSGHSRPLPLILLLNLVWLLLLGLSVVPDASHRLKAVIPSAVVLQERGISRANVVHRGTQSLTKRTTRPSKLQPRSGDMVSPGRKSRLSQVKRENKSGRDDKNVSRTQLAPA